MDLGDEPLGTARRRRPARRLDGKRRWPESCDLLARAIGGTLPVVARALTGGDLGRASATGPAIVVRPRARGDGCVRSNWSRTAGAAVPRGRRVRESYVAARSCRWLEQRRACCRPPLADRGARGGRRMRRRSGAALLGADDARLTRDARSRARRSGARFDGRLRVAARRPRPRAAASSSARPARPTPSVAEAVQAVLLGAVDLRAGPDRRARVRRRRRLEQHEPSATGRATGSSRPIASVDCASTPRTSPAPQAARSRRPLRTRRQAFTGAVLRALALRSATSAGLCERQRTTGATWAYKTVAQHGRGCCGLQLRCSRSRADRVARSPARAGWATRIGRRRSAAEAVPRRRQRRPRARREAAATRPLRRARRWRRRSAETRPLAATPLDFDRRLSPSASRPSRTALRRRDRL